MRILREQNQRRTLRRLFQNLQQAVRCFLHKRRSSENRKRPMPARRRPIIRRVNHRAHLPHLDQKLRRIRRHDQHIRMGLNQDSCLALVRIPHIVACSHGFRNPLIQVGRLRDAHTIRAVPAKIRQPIAFRRLQTIHRLRQHQGKRVLACTLRPGKNQRLRKMPAAQPFPQIPHG